ncbi:hypothetical protein EC604_23220 [Paenibacillus amylolyticus]|uniref:DUF4935 domain-containing protein n=1 Tax=Paenibacillus amylolyticus TaxID=1451 RepID=A0A5M9WYX8_PAEAM|nr:PIN domain-containing protein [Paenibacillus amylolyticus]KAA8786742.1 hypothetical protein EC604_23220 [Paenibacillus amylolyticus]
MKTYFYALMKETQGKDEYLQKNGFFSGEEKDFEEFSTPDKPQGYENLEYKMVYLEIERITEINYLLLDTNVWLYLLNNYYNDNGKLLNALLKLCVNKKVQLVHSDQVEEEFKRNYDNVFNKVMQSYDTKIDQFIDVVSKLDMSAYHAEQWFKKVKSAKDTYISDSYGVRLELILRVFEEFQSFPIETTDKVKIRAAELALNKESPFFGSIDAPEKKEKKADSSVKNSMGDAIIFLSYLEFIKGKRYQSAFFISANSTDFCGAGTNTLHSNLKELIINENINLNFDISLAKYINQIDAEILKVQPLPMLAFKCTLCNTTYNINGNQFVARSTYSNWQQVWWHQCPHCFTTYETNEEFNID